MVVLVLVLVLVPIASLDARAKNLPSPPNQLAGGSVPVTVSDPVSVPQDRVFSVPRIWDLFHQEV